MTKTLRPLDERIAARHGSGGRAMRALIEGLLTDGIEADPRHEGCGVDAMDDGAAIRVGEGWLVLTTDSHVVHPLFFPGGDIGRLAIAGTVNDLAMMGATEPLALTLAVVLEAGFPRAVLERIQRSMVHTCHEAGATIWTGDTKVMGRGELDGVVLNTTGVALCDRIVRDCGLKAGDRILVTGTIAEHGLAVMAARHKLALDGELRSDVAPINELVRVALEAGGDDLVAMKDPTRGGVASALHEMAGKSGVGVLLDEASLPLTAPARAAAELLGIDPLHVANEGKALMGVRAGAVERVLEALREHPLGRNASVIGTCLSDHLGQVILETGFGRRLVNELEGDPLPRIC